MKRRERSGLAVVPPFVWLVIFFLAPFVLVLKLSFSDVALAMPPYAPHFDVSRGLEGVKAFLECLDLENCRRLAEDPLYVQSYRSSLKFAATSTALLLLAGYPMAYGMARCSRPVQAILLPAVIVPFCTSFLIRVYAWIGILKPAGLLNAFLGVFGVSPLHILDTDTAVYIGLVYAYLPFMVLPLYAALEKQDESLLEAAADLGASRVRAFWSVTFPISLPAVAAGCSLCFIPIIGEFVVPDLLGGSETLMVGRTIWTEFFSNRDWPSASAAATVLLATLVIPIVIYQRWLARAAEAGL